MTDDPDELRAEIEAEKKEPARLYDAAEEIEIHLRYGLPRIKLIGWIIVILLALILWRVWRP